MLPTRKDDPLLWGLGLILHASVRVLAVLSIVLVVWGVVTVGADLLLRARELPASLLDTNAIVGTFGEILTVMIAVELFANVVLLLREERVAVDLVLATALTAMARKLIVVDYAKISAGQLWATAAGLFALVIGYRLLRQPGEKK